MDIYYIDILLHAVKGIPLGLGNPWQALLVSAFKGNATKYITFSHHASQTNILRSRYQTSELIG